MIMGSDLVKPKTGFWIEVRAWIAKIKCEWMGHTGPIVGQGQPMIVGKKNHPPLTLKTHWIRKCKRFRCTETFSHPNDVITSADFDSAARSDSPVPTVRGPSIHQKETLPTRR